MNHPHFVKYTLLSLWLLLFIGGCVWFAEAGIPLSQYPARITILVQRVGIWAPLFFVILYSLRSLLFFPATILTLAAGALFGPSLGILYTFIGENASANLSFFIGRYFGTSLLDHPLHRERATKALTSQYFLQSNGFMSILLMRLLYFPFDIVGYIAGASGISHRSFFFANALGILPGLLSFVFLGGALWDIRNLFLAGFFFAFGLILSSVLSNSLKSHRQE